jgi:hypothetical protein
VTQAYPATKLLVSDLRSRCGMRLLLYGTRANDPVISSIYRNAECDQYLASAVEEA